MKIKKFKNLLIVLIFLLLFANFIYANESRDGFVRLLLDERDGSFRLFYMQDNEEYMPLFYSSSSTSYLSVNVDGRVHRLGRSRAFATRIERIDRNPAVIYESPFLLVRVLYTPVKTISSPNANGIQMQIEIQNKTEEEISLGLRFLLDTHFGEERGMIPFVVGDRNITNETVIRRNQGERYWISKGSEISLMGNIAPLFNGNSRTPDYIHIANWQKLNEVPWNAPIREGFTFNHLPYSLNDTAVCYFWEPETLSGGSSFSYTVYLTTEDTAWYTWMSAERTISPTINISEIETAAAIEALESEEDADLITLRLLYNIIERFIAGEIFLNEQDIFEIERSIESIRINF